MEKINLHGYEIEVGFDEFPCNPLEEMDFLGTLVCFHNRYDLGHKNHNYDSDDYSNWEEMKKDIIKREDPLIILPLYLYDHSGITISTTPFSCPWDSGQIGFIFVSKEKIREEYSVKRITSKLKEKVEKYLIGEVETYDQYLRGEIYYFKVLQNDNVIDSCFGFYDKEECLGEAKGIVEHLWTERNCTVVD